MLAAAYQQKYAIDGPDRSWPWRNSEALLESRIFALAFAEPTILSTHFCRPQQKKQFVEDSTRGRFYLAAVTSSSLGCKPTL